MKKRTQFSILMFAGVVASCANAETLVMGKVGSGENPHSFYLPTDWIKSDGTVINSAPTSGNDYIVANGYTMNVGNVAKSGMNTFSICIRIDQTYKGKMSCAHVYNRIPCVLSFMLIG